MTYSERVPYSMPVETITAAMEHWTECQRGRPHCEHPVHRWSWDDWRAAIERLADGIQSWILAESAPQRAHMIGKALKYVLVLAERVQTTATQAEHRNGQLTEELAQLQAGHLLRSHEEILDRLTAIHNLIAQPKVTARSQYAASRVAEALKWVLEGPRVPTATSFEKGRLA